MKITCLWVVLIALFLLGGCNQLRATVSPSFQGKTVPVDKIGVGGAGASIAVQEFIGAGYNAAELGAVADDALNKARQLGFPYIAIVDAVDTSQSVWDGFYSFSMRVSDSKTGSIVWSGSATYGQGGIFINLQASAKEAYHDLIADLAKTFPPEQKIAVPQKK